MQAQTRRFRVRLVCVLAICYLLTAAWLNDGVLVRVAKADPVVSPGPKLHGETFPPELVSRIANLVNGQSPTASDITLVLRGLTDRDRHISTLACLAVARMAPHKSFDAQTTIAAVKLLAPKLRSEDDDTSEFSAQALGALAQYTPFVRGPSLKRAFVEAVNMVEAGDPEIRRRGFNLGRDLMPLLKAPAHDRLVSFILTVCRRPVLKHNPEAARKRGERYADGDVRALSMGDVALSVGALGIEDEKLARAVAAELMEAVKQERTAWLDASAGPLFAVAKLANRVDEPTRRHIAEFLIAATADNQHYVTDFMSGRQAPFHHVGADALAVIAPLLDQELLSKAEHAIPQKVGPGLLQSEYQSMYGPALKALAERRGQIGPRRVDVEKPANTK